MEESPNDRLRRLNREKQARWAEKHKTEHLQKLKDDRKLFKELKSKYLAEKNKTGIPVSPPTPAPKEPQRLKIRVNRRKKQVVSLEYCKEKIDELEKPDSTKKIYKNYLKTIHFLTNFKDLNTELLNVPLLMKKLTTGKQKKNPNLVYGINTVKGFIQSICFAFDQISGMEIPTDVKNKWREEFDIYKEKSKKKTEDEQSDAANNVMDAQIFLENCEATFGQDSKEYLICRLYKEVICRDDFGKMLIVSSKNEATNKEKNYIIIPNTRSNCSILLNNYKTSKKYMSFETGLSKELSNLLRNYCNKHKLNAGDFLFSEETLSSYISLMMTKMNLGGSKAVIYLRRMFISNELRNTKMSETERKQFARKCFHSPVANLRYVRQIV